MINRHYCKSCGNSMLYEDMRPRVCSYCGAGQTAQAAFQQKVAPRIQPIYEEEEEDNRQAGSYNIDLLSKAIKINIAGAQSMSFKQAMDEPSLPEGEDFKRKGITKKDFKNYKAKMESETPITYDPDVK